jgi:CHAT domain-containing protein
MHRLILDRSQVRQSIVRLLSAAADPGRPVSSVRAEGRFLFEELIAPTVGTLPSETVLTVLPDAEISAMPFDLLVNAQGRWLGEYCATVFAGHATHVGSPWTPPRRVLAVGSPATQETLPPLPESKIEAETVAARFTGSTLLTGLDATVDAVTRGMQHAELLHYSGHGYAGASVGGLYLTDSLLTSSSVQDLSLPACRLAVLSACLTAVGQTGGLTNPESLVHALLDAGAQTVISSRWSIDSSATASLMALFYSDLQMTGVPAQSLHHASQLLRARTHYAHPYYWSAFQTYE